MRILIQFKNKEKFFYRQNELGGMVYFLISKTKFNYLHNLPQNQPRFFNFSQLFLTHGFLSLIISSPLNELIKNLFMVVKKEGLLRVGKNLLEIKEVKITNLKIKKPIIIKTETPIIIRIPKDRYQDYGIENLSFLKNYQYFYWRPKEGIPFEPFIKQLEAAVYKKYKIFSGNETKEKSLFLKSIYKSTVDLPYFKDGKKISRIGTLWNFWLNDKVNLNLLKFILDTGVGELNSQGYGFLNLCQT